MIASSRLKVSTTATRRIRRISELGKRFVQELEAFFVNYHELDSEQFKIL